MKNFKNTITRGNRLCGFFAMAFLLLLAGCDEEVASRADGKAYTSFTVRGVNDGGNETLTRSNEAPITVTQDLGDGVFLTGELLPETSSTARATLEALTDKAKYRVIVYKQGTGDYVGQADCTVNPAVPNSNPTIELEVGTAYKVVAYSINTTAALPALAVSGNPETLQATDVFSGSADLMWWEGTLTAAVGDNTVSIDFSRKYSKITTKLDASGMPSGQRTIQSVSGVTLSPKYNATMTIATGAIAKNGSAGTAAVAFGTISSPNPASITSIEPQTIIYSGGEALKVSIPSINVGGTAYTDKTITFSTVPASGKAYTLTAKFTKAIDPTIVPPDWGNKFTGLMCMDIAQGNNNANGCGSTASRYPRRTDFTNRTEQDTKAGSVTPPYSGVQVYTFTSTKNVSNVRFYVQTSDSKNLLSQSDIIEGIQAKANYSGSITANTPCKVVVSYKSTLQTALVGRKRTEAVIVNLYAVYFDATANADRSVKISVRLQDCACCGANLKIRTGGSDWFPTYTTEWRNFMCHNLGADESKDPFFTNGGNNSTNNSGDETLLGGFYQWGRTTDGHQHRNSSKSYTQLTSVLPGNNRFIIHDNNWLTPADDNLWGAVKTQYDPCPPGWRVPTADEFSALREANDPITIVSDNVAMAGDLLPLPCAGERGGSTVRDGAYTGGTSSQPPQGFYWSSTAYSLNRAYYFNFYRSKFGTGGGNWSTSFIGRTHGLTVRCIEDK